MANEGKICLLFCKVNEINRSWETVFQRNFDKDKVLIECKGHFANHGMLLGGEPGDIGHKCVTIDREMEKMVSFRKFNIFRIEFMY